MQLDALQSLALSVAAARSPDSVLREMVQGLGTWEGVAWLRVFADHAAVAIANARAFGEIARLKENAERERDYLREAVRSALSPSTLSYRMKQLGVTRPAKR